MTVGLAAVVDRAEDGVYRGVTFTREQIKEIRYAGLLHDFGKVGVREQVLHKAKKLYPLQPDLIGHRPHYVGRPAEREFWRKRAEFLEAHERKDYEPFLRALEEEHAREIQVLDGFLDAVLSANEPTVLPAGRFEALLHLSRRSYEDPTGRPRSEEHTSELQSPCNLVCRLLLEKKKTRRTETPR